MTRKVSSGLVIIQDHKLLLVHPKNASWWHTYSIPKGEVNEGEELMDAAIRETKEETGLEFSRSQCRILEEIHLPKKSVFTFIVETDTPVSLADFIPNNEVDWIGFLNKGESRKRIHPGFEPLLQYLK